METTKITDATVEYVQLLAKCDISKEDLTDAIQYFRDIATQFNLIFADAPRKFSNNAKLVGGKLFEKFIKLLGQHEVSNEVEYYVEEGQEDITCENVPSTSQSIPDEEYELPQEVSAHNIQL
ncbi:23s rrna methyltransferase, partial [Lasius niger]